MAMKLAGGHTSEKQSFDVLPEGMRTFEKTR